MDSKRNKKRETSLINSKDLKKKTNYEESGKYFEESSNESIRANNYIHNNYERFDSNDYL